MGLSSRSLKSLAFGALVAFLGAAGTGCVFTDGNDGGGSGTTIDTNPQPAAALQATIDADATLQVKGGDGVGVFAEYTTGGHWHVFTSCDSNQSTNPGVPCGFDVFASTTTLDATLSNAKSDGFEGKDALSLSSDGTIHLAANTTTGLDGMTFDAPVGAIVELDVWLDNQEDPHYIYWIGDKVLHQGAPSDPLDLVPSEKPVGASGNPAGGSPGTGKN